MNLILDEFNLKDMEKNAGGNPTDNMLPKEAEEFIKDCYEAIEKCDKHSRILHSFNRIKTQKDAYIHIWAVNVEKNLEKGITLDKSYQLAAIESVKESWNLFSDPDNSKYFIEF